LAKRIIKIPSVLGKNSAGVIMDKDEILEKAKKENKKKEPLVYEAYKTGITIGAIICAVLCMIFAVFEIIMHSPRYLGFLAITSAIAMGRSIGNAVKLKYKSDIIFAVIFGIAIICCTAAYIVLVVVPHFNGN